MSTSSGFLRRSAALCTAMVLTASVLLPLPAAHAAPHGSWGNVVEVASDKQFLTTLVAAVGAAGLADALGTTDPITVFAPTNAAFAALPAGTVESLLLPENKAQLVKILSYHVVAGKYRFIDVIKATLRGPVTLTTLSGDSLTVSRKGASILLQTPNGTSRVIRPNIMADNGVIHVIDSVLLP